MTHNLWAISPTPLAAHLATVLHLVTEINHRYMIGLLHTTNTIWRVENSFICFTV